VIVFTARIIGIPARVSAEVSGNGSVIVLAVKSIAGLGWFVRPTVNKLILQRIPAMYRPRMNAQANIELTIPGQIVSLSVDLAFGL